MHRAGWNSNDFDHETMEMVWSDSCLNSKGGTGGFRYKCSQDGYAFVSSGDNQKDIDNAYLMVICHQNHKNKTYYPD